MGFAKTKENRKLTKYSNILKKQFNIEAVITPTKILAVCNRGLTTGVSQAMVLEAMEPFGHVKEVILVPGESITFVEFYSVDDCSSAVNNENHVEWLQEAYLIYVDSIPPALHNISKQFSPPPGLIVLENFITEEEEADLLQCLEVDCCTNLKNRIVKHFGFEFRYTDNRADCVPIEPIPETWNYLWTRLLDMKGISFIPDQCTVNIYAPGQGIPPHVDTHSAFTEFIVSLSLQSSIVMDWRQNGEIRQVLVPRRSLCVFTEESRYGWTHGIASRKSDVVPSVDGGLTLLARSVRTSLTFRKTRVGDCDCKFPSLCDTAQAILRQSSPGVKNESAALLELHSVHQVYEEIADHFSETRHKPWPNVVKFLAKFPLGSLLLDVGCGNGKYLGCASNSVVTGCDRSSNLLSVCRSRLFPVFVCDCLSIPVPDNTMDGCISIAVIHHLSTEQRRLDAITELVRILRPGGQALVYVWAKNQQADSTKSSYLRQKHKKNRNAKVENTSSDVAAVADTVLPVHQNRTDFQHSDVFVPWQKKTSPGTEVGPTFLRFYHVFEENELRQLCSRIDNCICVDYYYDQGNWCIILEKK